MLKYLVQVTEDLLFFGVLTGLIYAFVGRMDGRRGRIIVTAAAAAGLIAAAVMSWFKNNTKMVNTGLWNMRILVASAIALVLFLLISLFHLSKAEKLKKIAGIVSAALGALTVALYIFYLLPDVLAYPSGFVGSDVSMLSSDFLLKLIGFIFGFVLVFLAGLAAYELGKDTQLWLLTALLTVGSALFELRFLAKSISWLRQNYSAIKRAVPFDMVVFASKYANNIIYTAMVIAVIAAAAMLVRCFTYNEPYDNPAQHRLIRAKWRRRRNWAILAIVCAVLALVTVTAIKAYDSREVELSPTEMPEVRDGNVYISLESVADGHLHRFGYTTKGGVEVRVIVIQKPNSTAYGVGLDACDICGKTGYYERNGQVVCNKCDVIMNINTIGFKGGCNPIVFDYTVSDGYIIIPAETLEGYERTFK